MADEKPKPKKPAPEASSGGGGGGAFTDAFFWILLVLVFLYVLSVLSKKIGLDFSGLPSFTSVFSVIFDKIQVFSVFLSLLFFLGIIYCNFKLGEVLHGSHGGHGHDDDTDHGHSEGDHHNAHAIPHKKEENLRWKSIVDRMESQNEADWRLAIIEADIILSEMLDRMSYHGEGVAEKLKNVEKSDFTTIESAWAAHKIRNEIAHPVPGFKLSRREAERAINLYKEVFEEFYFI